MSRRNRERRNRNNTPQNPPEPGNAKPSDLLTRRRFFTVAGLTLAGAGGSFGLYYYLRDRKLKYDPQDSAAPIRQADVDREYKSLFEYLKKAKEETPAGKKLIILAAEVHNNRNSLLLQFMLVDIAHRLGITEVLEEQDKHTLAIMDADAEKELRNRDNALNREIPDIADRETAQFAKRAFLISAFKTIPHHPFYSPEREVERNNTFLSMMTAKDVGMHYHPADPFHEQRLARAQRGEDVTEVFTDKYEAPMLNKIVELAEKDNCLGIFGAGHVPEFYTRLQKGGAHVVGIDCTAGVRFQEEQDIPQFVRERMRALDKLYVPKIKTLWHPDPGEALAMVLEASVKHQQERGELNRQDATLRKRLIDSIRPQGRGRGN